MMRVFVDASVLISAAISRTGAAHELIRYGVRGEAELVISPLVGEETRRNLASKAPDTLPFYELLIQVVPFTMVTPSTHQVQEVAETIAAKDAPIVAAAKRAEVDFLATWDRRHLLKAKEEAEKLGVAVATPAEVLAAIREEA